MKLITTSGNKTFKIIPRQYIEGAITVKLTSESTGSNVSVTPTATTDKNYMSFDAVFWYINRGAIFTFLEVKNGSDSNIQG